MASTIDVGVGPLRIDDEALVEVVHEMAAVSCAANGVDIEESDEDLFRDLEYDVIEPALLSEIEGAAGEAVSRIWDRVRSGELYFD